MINILKKMNYKKLHFNFFMVLSIASFIYSLGFSSNFRVLRSTHRPLYDLAQVTNRLIFNLSVFGLILVLIMLISGYKNKKRINKGQKAVISIIGIYTVVNMKLSINTITKFKTVYLDANFDKLDNYIISNHIFTFGIFIHLILMVTFIFFTYIVLKRKNK